MIALLVAAGALIGAPARYLTDRALQVRVRARFPWGTFTVNVVASLVLGAVAGAAPSAEVTAVVGTGLCGALSTFSTFSYEVLGLAHSGRWRAAAADVLLSVVGAVGAVALGYWLGSSA